MFNKLYRNKAQTTLEYAILIGVIVAGLIAMQVYLKRGFQGKLRESADSMGQQFSPGNTTNTYTTRNDSTSTETLAADQVTTSLIEQSSTKTGTEAVATSDTETWMQR